MLAGRRCSSFTVASSRTWRHGLQRCAAVVGYGVSRCGGRTEEFLGKTSSARLIAVPPVEIVFARDPCVLPWCSLFQVVAGAAAPGEVYKPVEVGAVPRLSHSALSLRWNDTSESSASTGCCSSGGPCGDTDVGVGNALEPQSRSLVMKNHSCVQNKTKARVGCRSLLGASSCRPFLLFDLVAEGGRIKHGLADRGSEGPRPIEQQLDSISSRHVRGSSWI